MLLQPRQLRAERPDVSALERIVSRLLRFALFFAISFFRCSLRCASPGARVLLPCEVGGRKGE